MNRLRNFFRALFNKFFDTVEDPEMMLDQAKRDMGVMLSKNRERAVQAITQRNQLVKMLEDTQNKVISLEKQAEMALRQNKRELAATFLVEKKSAEVSVINLTASVANAEKSVEAVKLAMKHQEEELRKKTADALVLKANYKAAQAQNEIAKALDSMSFEDVNSSWGAASEKIGSMQSQAAARAEMQAESLSSKVMALEDASHIMEAEDELAALEARLGLTKAPTIGTNSTINAETISVEDELQALEQRLHN